MKYLLILLLICFSIPCQAGTTIYAKNMEDAIVLSEETDLDILMIFSADYCVYCDKLKKDIENDPEMIVDKIICYVDVEENTELAKKYRVGSIPDSRVIKKGKVIKKLIGYKNKKSYKEFLEK